MKNTPCFTASTGTVFHDINTEGGWSGSPIVRFNSGLAKITGMHIAGVPGPPLLNVAVSANLVERMARAKDSSFIPTFNCPLTQLRVITLNDGEEEVLYCEDEKSTNKKMATQSKRDDRARRRKLKGKQIRRSRGAGWKAAHGKPGKRLWASTSLSSANYDKLKQAASLAGDRPQVPPDIGCTPLFWQAPAG